MNFFGKHFGEPHIKQHPLYGLLVELSTFLEELKKASLPTDTVKFKRGNVERTLNGYRNGTISLEDDENLSQKQWVTSSGILKYIFKHSCDITFCSTLAEEVETIVCNQGRLQKSDISEENTKLPNTILELYRLLTTLSLREPDLENFYSNFFQLDEADVPTLYSVHKGFFSENDWKKIMYFEHHFALACGSEPQRSVEDELQKRLTFLQQLTTSSGLREELLASNKRTIQHRNLRKESAESRIQTQIKGAYVHLYTNLDNQVKVEAQKYFPDVGDIITIPSVLTNHVSICLNMSRDISLGVKYVHNIVSGYLVRKHSLQLDKVFVLATETVKSYHRKDLKGYARFILHDDLITRKVTPAVVYGTETNQDEDDNMLDLDDRPPVNCEYCFSTVVVQPLEISSFALVQEWVMDVPLTVQLLLESSISIHYFKESSDKLKFLQPKLMKLYMSYDTMLNNLNKKYIGLLQHANTLELVMHSKCLTSVFQIASNSGIAMSLASAARHLESNTVDDLLYYNTYLKSQPLTYRRKGLQVTANVCLRDCIIILMIDNLVRLKFKDDPNPGENRSKQLNTLPITIQGLPVDSDEVASWHLNSCDGSLKCSCRETQDIASDDLAPLMVTLLPSEEDASRNFSQLCTWGYPDLWKQLLKGAYMIYYYEPLLIINP